VLYDDDHYYMGGICAELLVKAGHQVTLVTPAPEVSTWTRNTLEQDKIQARLLNMGVEVIVSHVVAAAHADHMELACVFTGKIRPIPADGLVLVTARLPLDQLYLDLKAREPEWLDAGISNVKGIGDCWAPSTIAAATYAGRRYAEEFDAPDIGDALPFKREMVELLP